MRICNWGGAEAEPALLEELVPATLRKFQKQSAKDAFVVP